MTTSQGPIVRVPLRPHQLVERVTPANDVFVLAHLGVVEVDARTWSLEIDGLVQKQRHFEMADLRQLPQVEVETAHECCGNPLQPRVPERRIVNVRWGGVPLPSLLELVGVHDAARFVWSYGLDHGTLAQFAVDAYVKDLPLSHVADAIIAYELNGAPLTAEHGFPARLVVPGWYGTNNVKWLRRLRLADRRADSPSRPCCTTMRLTHQSGRSHRNQSSSRPFRMRDSLRAPTSRSGAGRGPPSLSRPSKSAWTAAQRGTLPRSCNGTNTRGNAFRSTGALRRSAKPGY